MSDKNIIFSKPMNDNERMYAKKQSIQIAGQCGYIGCLTIFSETKDNWECYRGDLDTTNFAKTLILVANAFNEHKILWAYEKGTRADANDYTFLFVPGENETVECYCYINQWLNSHLNAAKNGIRFIKPDYKELFRIFDGDSVLIKDKDEKEIKTEECRYIDEYHVEVGDNLYHICELAERMQEREYKLYPVMKDMTVRHFLLNKTDVGRVVCFHEGGWFIGCTKVDSEDLFIGSLNPDMLNKNIESFKHEEIDWIKNKAIILNIK